MAFVRVCRADEVPAGAMRRIDAGPEPVVICNVAGELYALDDTCTHSNWSLADGDLEGDVLVCPLHQARFSARTGAVLALPAPDPLKVYPLRVEGQEVWVDLEAGAVAER